MDRPVDQIKWLKGNTELASIRNSQSLDLDTASIADNIVDRTAIFGTYTCEATVGADKIKNTVHIAERGIIV